MGNLHAVERLCQTQFKILDTTVVTTFPNTQPPIKNADFVDQRQNLFVYNVKLGFTQKAVFYNTIHFNVIMHGIRYNGCAISCYFLNKFFFCFVFFNFGLKNTVYKKKTDEIKKKLLHALMGLTHVSFIEN
jgi:hypothetical protein